MNVAERLGDQRPAPVGIAVRRRRIEHRQDAPADLLIISGFSSTIAGLGKAGKRIGTWITTLKQKSVSVAVRFSDGRSEDYDLIIGADGIGSSVRSLTLTETAPSYAGQMVWRSLAPIRHETPDEVQFWLGHGCFFGLYPVSKKHTYGFGYINEQERRHDPVFGRLKRLRERFAEFGGLVKAYVANLECDEQIHCAAIESLELYHWRKGRVVLIGDAGMPARR